MGAFLRFARKGWFNYVCATGMAIASIVALVALWGDWSSAPFVLTAIGLAIVIVGVYVVSNVWKEPLYDVILAWDPEAMPAGWEAARCRHGHQRGRLAQRQVGRLGSRGQEEAAEGAFGRPEHGPGCHRLGRRRGRASAGAGGAVRGRSRCVASWTSAASNGRRSSPRTRPSSRSSACARSPGTGSASSAVPACGRTCFATASATPAGPPGTPTPPASCWPATQ
jgi:hypothetical protein